MQVGGNVAVAVEKKNEHIRSSIEEVVINPMQVGGNVAVAKWQGGSGEKKKKNERNRSRIEGDVAISVQFDGKSGSGKSGSGKSGSGKSGRVAVWQLTVAVDSGN
jgi:hypothetical protein